MREERLCAWPQPPATACHWGALLPALHVASLAVGEPCPFALCSRRGGLPGHSSQGSDSAPAATCCVGAATSRVTASREGRGTEQNWMDPKDPQLRAGPRTAQRKRPCLGKTSLTGKQEGPSGGPGSRMPGPPTSPRAVTLGAKLSLLAHPPHRLGAGLPAATDHRLPGDGLIPALSDLPGRAQLNRPLPVGTRPRLPFGWHHRDPQASHVSAEILGAPLPRNS